MPLKPVSVSQPTSYIQRTLAPDPILMTCSVKGEVSGLTKHSSGHWYFSLKDDNSRINCFLSRDRVPMLRFDISEGMEITAYGSVSVYERGGSYSLNVRDLDVEGEGALKQAFENLKKKLSEEGLFDQSHKRPICRFPKRIGVVTSPTGAAVRDIITTVRRRNPLVDVLIYPCIVQGTEAAASICAAIEDINRKFPDLDTLIVGRGGGSAEDLWCFNEESVARAVYNSAIPVISAVGHEVDWLISDYAADLRGATPTAAAELAVPHIAVLADKLELYTPQRLFSSLEGVLEMADIKLRRIKDGLDADIEDELSSANHRLQMLKLDIEMSNPMNVLDRGYAIARDKDGKWIEKAAAAKAGSQIDVIFKDGLLNCLVQEVKTGND
ncbi:MAG: exodeoxyribonuclease VII large subunit [Clostridia bacterium]|nr:exodeoxyribonuclease VII large subunit [Clostridia bacterium]